LVEIEARRTSVIGPMSCVSGTVIGRRASLTYELVAPSFASKK